MKKKIPFTIKIGIYLLVFIIAAAGCRPSGYVPDAHRITILYTNDEHGWMAGDGEGNSAANLAGLWEKTLSNETGDILILSGGDNWTGPAVSTWFHGQGMVELMNVMGYHAAAVGNHEFDFGLDVLKTRLSEADFPYLSANLRKKSDGQVPLELGIQPYTILELENVNIGIIGLTTTRSAEITHPAHTSGFDFVDYRETLLRHVPEMRAQGAQIIILVSHICSDELVRLAWQVKSLGIAVMTGGHCHERFAYPIGNTILVSGGSHFESYALVQLDYDPDTFRIIRREYSTFTNQGGHPDHRIAGIIDRWQVRTDAELSEPIGYLENMIPRRSKSMGDLITHSWMQAFPGVDAALTNPGGVRDNLPPGNITRAHIVSVLPFDNTLVEVHLNGAQLKQVLEYQNNLITGEIHLRGSEWYFDKSGLPLEKNKMYRVIVNDFMYAGGDSYDMLAEFDPEAYNSQIDWRDPLVEWIISQHSSAEFPLEITIETSNTWR